MEWWAESGVNWKCVSAPRPNHVSVLDLVKRHSVQHREGRSRDYPQPCVDYQSGRGWDCAVDSHDWKEERQLRSHDVGDDGGESTGRHVLSSHSVWGG